jgi:hypothetical protein
MATAEARLLRAVANHVLLPPDLPGGVDKNLSEISRDLLRRVRAACVDMNFALEGEHRQVLNSLRTSLDYCERMHTSLTLDSTQLQWAAQQLSEQEILIIHVQEQNAGLLIRHGAG